mmetsp:Transcript_28059/g.65449  ORF Transcript_28059/g.65449 Transcript_28059/m.65449 type:complete len:93 (-) Transcript_28059:203-481(-)
MTIYTCRNVGTRTCKVNPNEAHNNNNAFIKHARDCSVSYHCVSPSCRSDYNPVVIGKMQPFDQCMHIAVSELALMGPAQSFDDALAIIIVSW